MPLSDQFRNADNGWPPLVYTRADGYQLSTLISQATGVIHGRQILEKLPSTPARQWIRIVVAPSVTSS
ncbi:hypothetical protein PBV52_50805 [Streptomyces sp. T12]|uniref:hypothetical protein n=1 Tax=Streptomyces sp. T12 TaxID=477697 RepID=UPI0023651F27|nr:hypothetical protein [Streptomyces sp. T12]WDF44484.1 hypothetical protein PBV52_50805 [Streptomyces sp. T12]